MLSFLLFNTREYEANFKLLSREILSQSSSICFQDQKNKKLL